MRTAELISHLSGLGVELWAQGGRLRLNAPKGIVNSALRLELSQRKGEILKLLGEQGRTSAEALPRAVPRPEQRHEPFPLTDLQEAYWIGRTGDFELGNVGSHFYLEIDFAGLDLGRLDRALQRLIERHDMLRVIFLPEGRQQILEQVPAYEIAAEDLSHLQPEEIEARLAAIRQATSHQILPTDRWPLFDVRASLLDGGKTRLHMSLDLLTGDVWSFELFFRELFVLYRDSAASLPELELSFRDYLVAEKEFQSAARYRRSQDYWWRRVPTLPPGPELPLARLPGSIEHPRFERRNTRLEPALWGELKRRATEHELTPSGLLLTVFADVLATWSKSPRFTLNLTFFNRLPLHPQIHEIMGDFSATLLLEVDARGATFAQRARQLQRRLWDDLEHSHVSGVRVLRQMARSGRGQATMPVVFTSNLNQTGGGGLAGGSVASDLTGEMVYSISQTPQVWIDHRVSEDRGALVFNWDAVEELFAPGMLDEMFSAYCERLEQLALDAGSWHRQEPLLPALGIVGRQEIVAEELPPDGLLADGFFEQARQAPERPAVIAGDRRLSYGELAAESAALAVELRRLGASPEQLVAVVAAKGWEQAAGALGILASGAAYLPIDPQLPAERIHYLLEHGRVRLAVTTPRLAEEISWPDGVRPVVVEPRAVGRDDPDLGAAVSSWACPENLAYTIFTSGSTGQPKGVMIEHRAALNTIVDVNERFAVGPTDRVLALSSLSFDLSVYDLFGLLAAGGAAVLPEPSALRDPRSWLQTLRDEGVTVWSSVPTLMQMLVEYVEGRGERLPDSLRLVMMSGDWIPVGLPDRIRALCDEVEVISLGGATEASIWSILYPIGKVDSEWKSIPYGRAMKHQTFHVLDRSLEERPTWVPGQLYIGGVGVARGYWADARRTAESFVVHPRSRERLYATGDLGRYLPDGTIEFLGREDFQVKVQGYRVELGEIEAALAQHPEVEAAVVTATGEARGNRRLVAYVVGRSGAAPDVESLRGYLRDKLPAYMVPGVFVALDRLPLTPTGKVNRKQLPAPVETADKTTGPAPSSELDALSARITAVVVPILELEELDPAANLLDLGANSVDLIRVINQLEKELGARPRIEDFYRSPTVIDLARFFDREQRGEDPREVGEPAPVGVDGRWQPAELLFDPDERDAFKQQQKARRRDLPQRRAVELEPAAKASTLAEPLLARRTYWHYAETAVPLTALGHWLACLEQRRLDGKPKHTWPSAGGLYPLQVYLHAKPGRVEGLGAGVYYYDPLEHRLHEVTPGAAIPAAIHSALINRPVFEEAAFSVFLIADAAAIAPVYGPRARDFCLIEAGCLLQTLMLQATELGLGVCPIGGLDFAAIREHFALGESHELIHSMVGGLAADEAEAGFADPGSLAALVPADAASGTELPPLEPASRDGELPLSFSQARLWFLDQLDPGNPAYNLAGAYLLSGRLDVAALAASVTEIVARHEVLRTRFISQDGEARQIIVPPQAVDLPRVDLRQAAEARREAEVRRLARQEAWRPFDLASVPHLRATLVLLDEERTAVLFTLHHIASDAWSMAILIKELVVLYAAYVGGHEPRLPVLPVQYADFAAWQRGWLQGEVLETQLDYWRRQLAGAPAVLTLPTDAPRSAEVTHRGAVEAFALPSSVREGLVRLGREEEGTLYVALLAAYKVLLCYCASSTDIVVGSPITNRRRAETEDLIGFFVNTLVLRTDLSGNPTFRQLMRRVRDTTLGAFAHQDLPFERLVDALRPTRDLAHSPLFQVWFVLQDMRMPSLDLPGLSLRTLGGQEVAVRHDLKLELAPSGDGLKGTFEYKAELFSRSTIRRWVSHFETVLQTVVNDPDQPLEALRQAIEEADRAQRQRAANQFGESRRQKLAGLRRRRTRTAPADESKK